MSKIVEWTETTVSRLYNNNNNNDNNDDDDDDDENNNMDCELYISLAALLVDQRGC